MEENEIPKQVVIELNQLSESIQKFHLNSAINAGISVEEHLLEFIRKATEAEQELIREEHRVEWERKGKFGREVLGIQGNYLAEDLEIDEEEKTNS